MKIKSIITAFILSITLTGVAIANNGDEKINTETKLNEGPKTIVGVAASNENFSTLVTAVKAANLVDILNGDGPFTVFAPTNDAFAKLPEGTVSNLLKKENKEVLTGILTYHVVSGSYTASDVVTAIKKNNGKFLIPTVQGGTITASVSNGNVILTDMNGNTSTVIITDVKASNGVIHAIDSVVMPK